MTLNRITPDDVRAARAKTGLPLTFGEWCGTDEDTRYCACPIAQIAIADRGFCDDDEIIDWANERFTEAYTEGFVDAVDRNKKLAPSWHSPNERGIYALGYADGQAVRAAADRGEL